MRVENGNLATKLGTKMLANEVESFQLRISPLTSDSGLIKRLDECKTAV